MSGPSDESWRPVITMDPPTTFRHKVRAEELTGAITPNDDVFVLAHFGIPQFDATAWRLHVEGLVKKPLALTLDDIKRLPKIEIESFIKCAGFPHDPTIATRNVSNAKWAGADLRDVLDAAGLDPAAQYLWASAPDHGTYARWSADRYRKDVPVSRVRTGGVLLAYEMNGEPLPQTHGFPVRLFIPGFYGTNSVKWICRLEASRERAPGILTNELYNDPAPGGGTAPVWQVAPESLIVAPADHDKITPGVREIWGWCWGEHAIAAVEVSLDEGQSWRTATVEPRRQMAWQRFSLVAECAAGPLTVMARATDAKGQTQPAREARNAVHAVKVLVT
ncbi:MAG TPA: molybdopterin-dependent oxidoreductase [Pseudolabrys sp.]|nr:molybdopterin-dependent oxidoreductase [Pseudolabrys sp.]